MDEFKLKFKTGSWMGNIYLHRMMLPFYIVPFGAWVFWDEGYYDPHNPLFWIANTILIYTYIFVLPIFISDAIKCYQTIEIDKDNVLHGKNSFGKILKPFPIKDVIDIKRYKKTNSFSFVLKKGEKKEIWNPIDYAGFIYDYIICTSGIHHVYEYKWLKEIIISDFWRYSPDSEPMNRYEVGYLDWLNPLVKKQLLELQERAILDKKVEFNNYDQEYEQERQRDSIKQSLIEKRHEEWSNREDL